MKRLFFIVLSLSFLLVACSEKYPIKTNMSEKVGEFTFTTQDEQQLSNEDLNGQWWIADFIFTNCTTVCLPMSYNMSQLQTQLQEENIDIQFISFSVDPDYDSPKVLTEYGKDNNADFDNWTFLTGYDFQTIKEISIKSFRAPLKEPESGSDQVLHDTRFFLVDPEGNIIKGYDGRQAENMNEIIEDLKTLKKHEAL